MNAQQELLLLRNQEALLRALRDMQKNNNVAVRKRLNDQLTDTTDRISLLEAHVKHKLEAAKTLEPAMKLPKVGAVHP